MAYEIKFASLSGSDWAEIVEAIDSETNLPLTDIDTALIELHVQDDCNQTRLKASTADGTIVIPKSGQFQWRFTKEQMAGLHIGTTYSVGCRITPVDGGTSPLFTGSLAYVDGEFFS